MERLPYYVDPSIPQPCPLALDPSCIYIPLHYSVGYNESDWTRRGLKQKWSPGGLDGRRWATGVHARDLFFCLTSHYHPRVLIHYYAVSSGARGAPWCACVPQSVHCTACHSYFENELCHIYFNPLSSAHLFVFSVKSICVSFDPDLFLPLSPTLPVTLPMARQVLINNMICSCSSLWLKSLKNCHICTSLPGFLSIYLSFCPRPARLSLQQPVLGGLNWRGSGLLLQRNRWGRRTVRTGLNHTHTHTHTRKLQAVSRSDTGPYGRPLELLPFAEKGRDGWRDVGMTGGWKEEEEGGGGN